MRLEFNYYRHPELVSGSILRLGPLVLVDRWMLKQVQHDDDFEESI